MDIRESYDSAAAAHVADELVGRPLDRHLLSRLVEDVRERGEVAAETRERRDRRPFRTRRTVGDEIVHVDELFAAPVSLDFSFQQAEMVMRALREAGFMTLERSEREPYAGIEYPSRRAQRSAW